MERVVTEWRRFVEGLVPDRSAAPEAAGPRPNGRGLDEVAEPLALASAAGDELGRRRECDRLLAAAAPHLNWLSNALGAEPHLASLVDAEGVVLYSVGTDTPGDG